MSLDAVTCTIELSTGSLLEIALTPREIFERSAQTMVDEYGRAQGFIPLPVLTGTDRSDADYRQEVYVDFTSIVAIYPLDERPIPPARINLGRVEAYVKT